MHSTPRNQGDAIQRNTPSLQQSQCNTECDELCRRRSRPQAETGPRVSCSLYNLKQPTTEGKHDAVVHYLWSKEQLSVAPIDFIESGEDFQVSSNKKKADSQK